MMAIAFIRAAAIRRMAIAAAILTMGSPPGQARNLDSAVAPPVSIETEAAKVTATVLPENAVVVDWQSRSQDPVAITVEIDGLPIVPTETTTYPAEAEVSALLVAVDISNRVPPSVLAIVLNSVVNLSSVVRSHHLTIALTFDQDLRLLSEWGNDPVEMIRMLKDAVPSDVATNPANVLDQSRFLLDDVEMQAERRFLLIFSWQDLRADDALLRDTARSFRERDITIVVVDARKNEQARTARNGYLALTEMTRGFLFPTGGQALTLGEASSILDILDAGGRAVYDLDAYARLPLLRAPEIALRVGDLPETVSRTLSVSLPQATASDMIALATSERYLDRVLLLGVGSLLVLIGAALIIRRWLVGRSRRPPRLIAMSKPQRTFLMEQLPYTVGSGSDQDLTIPHGSVGPAELVFESATGGALRIRKVNAEAEVLLNGFRVTEEAVRDKDIVTIGGFRFRLRC